MGVLIDNRQNSHRISLAKIRTKARVILDALGSPEAELSILLVDDAAIAHLNQQYLSRPGPTNVIAFPMREGEFADVSPQLLGDVVISLDTAEREGAESGVALEVRLDELLVHGILHLFGYDHEKNNADAQVMAEKGSALMELIRTAGR
ncbi:MAG: rRNA maturation RNase YbeY [Desulfobacterales bacterium]|jgi:probable rRNA maturation factor